MSELKSLKECLIENLKEIISSSKDKEELKDAVEELEGLVFSLEAQVAVEKIENKQGMRRL